MGRQVYLSDKSIETFDLLESIFDWHVASGADYTDEQVKAVQELYDKIHGVNSK